MITPIKRYVLVSVSGGRTSGHLADRIQREASYINDELVFVFANTGQEHEETLIFLDRMDKEWGLNLIWLEAAVQEGRVGTKYKEVSFKTASRNGEPFEDVIRKYGIPNKAYPHCTRELKEAPIHSWAKDNLPKGYYSAIGIRADESKRCSAKAAERRFLYPLVDWDVDQQEVSEFWSEQPFDLGIEGYRGNCTWCWKKSFKKHYRLIKETPEIYNFPRRMEEMYGLAGHHTDDNKRVFFRGNLSTDTLFELANLNNTDHAEGVLDHNTGCEDHCEPFSELAE
jgi:hypothetical protein